MEKGIIALLIVCVLSVPQGAVAIEKLKKIHIQKTGLKSAESIENDSFEVVVPQGWSYLNHQDLKTTEVLLTPVKKMQTSLTSVKFRGSSTKPISIDKQHELRKKNKAHLVTETWNGAVWRILDYVKSNQHHWYAVSTGKEKTYTVNAVTPVSDEKKYSNVILNIMRFSRVKPRSAFKNPLDFQ